MQRGRSNAVTIQPLCPVTLEQDDWHSRMNLSYVELASCQEFGSHGVLAWLYSQARTPDKVLGPGLRRRFVVRRA